MSDKFGPDYLMAEHLLGAAAYGLYEDEGDDRITVSFVDSGWTWRDWAKVLTMAALCMTVIVLLAVLPALLAA